MIGNYMRLATRGPWVVLLPAVKGEGVRMLAYPAKLDLVHLLRGAADYLERADVERFEVQPDPPATQ